ncbi:hypothetical protein HPB48_020381 [Haemaphysalis longicornis]|uniref:DNA transposase THAP9 C-terminal domain-containing protein n=1 Tax=Haemaphysalis longicornis TaxID=44386 RepID=A0A9J6FZZ9_HAELO|nr:hypothetical protein HPB48_020381 [Haemaphysalis longicornis]
MLDKYHFHIFLLSRLSQDALENLFSTLRAKNPIPRLYDFKCSLRSATLSQFLRPIKSGSYADDEGFLLVGLEQQQSDETTEEVQCPDDLLDLSSEIEQVVIYLAGYVASKLRSTLRCENCRASLISDGAPSKLIELKNFSQSRQSLTNPSPALVDCENCRKLFPLQQRSTGEKCGQYCTTASQRKRQHYLRNLFSHLP